MKNTAHFDLNDRKITNARFVQVIQWPQIDFDLTPKLIVDNAIDESSLVRKNQDKDFNNNNSTNINSITLLKHLMTIKSLQRLMLINFIKKMNDQEEI